MLLGTELAAALKADAVLASYVGDRVYPVVLPQGTGKPAAYYRIVSSPRIHTLDGGAGGAAPRVQFGLCSYRYTDVPAMTRALKRLIDGFTGMLGALEVTDVYSDGEQDFAEDADDGSGRTLHHRACDYVIQYRETVPAPAGMVGTAEYIETALVAAVKDDADIMAIVGNRVYPGTIPQGTARPALWYSLLKRTDEPTLDADPVGSLATWRWGVQARDYTACEAVADLLRERFQGLAASLGSVEVTSGMAHDESDSTIDPQDGSGRVFYERAADYEFQITEPA